MAIVLASYALIPQLQAEESLRVATQIGLGTGSFTKDHAREISRTWSRQAFGEGPPAIHKPTADELAAMGIAMVRADG